MNQETIQILFALLRSAICGKQLSQQGRALYDPQILPQLYAVSKRHDIAHLLALGLDANGWLKTEKSEIKNEIIKAIYRYEQLNYAYQTVCSALETAKIPFIPLKGSVLRRYYPQPWMRTSCDMDILVHEGEAEKAASCLVDNCGCVRDGKGSHDISLFSKNKNHIELHYELVEDGLINRSAEVLKSVWDVSAPRDTNRYWFEMPDEMFYFYHIAHMAKHFVNGGCGIRPFIDLWILDNVEFADQDKRNELLQQGDLLKFAEAARLLSRVWFENAQHTEITSQMEHYILCGGVYGNSENRIAVQQQRKGGRLKYALSRIFLPYDVLKFHYPVLQKHRWLTPFMEVRRWCKLLFCGHAKRSMRELAYNQSISNAEAERIQKVLKNIGL